MQIVELSRRTGASVRSLRYYESKNLLSSTRLSNGYRSYEEVAIDRVKAIQLYLSIGLNTEEIAQIIDCRGWKEQDGPVCRRALELYQEKLEEITKQIAILEEVRLRLQTKIQTFEKTNQGEMGL
jgi:DNA-binding transcriptional MerR regulator